MTFNLGSLCMAILWNSIFIGIVFWIGKKKIYTTRKGIHLTLMFYLLGVVRMIFPIDFRPSIGIQVWKGVFPTVNYALSIIRIRGLLFLVRKVYSGGIFIFRTTIIRKKNYIMLCSMNVHISQMEICT